MKWRAALTLVEAATKPVVGMQTKSCEKRGDFARFMSDLIICSSKRNLNSMESVLEMEIKLK